MPLQTPHLVSKIDLSTLQGMESLLSRAAGYPVSLADEIDYFKDNVLQGWFVAKNLNGDNIGFIRSFVQGAEWSHGELYIDQTDLDRKDVAVQLLTHFLESNKFNSGHRLRFDINQSDLALNSAVESVGCSQQKQIFKYFEISLSQNSNAQESFEPVTEYPADEVANVLSHLHPVSSSEADVWIKNKSIRAIQEGSQIVCAAQIYLYPDSAEVNRIATSSRYLRQGYAKALLNKICTELSASGIPKLFLQVEDQKIPAVAFYRDFGFQENVSKAQIWHSKWF